MYTLSKFFVGLVATIHVYILVLEMFLWERAIIAFNIPVHLQDESMIQNLLLNQGLYNGFLAAGLIWSLVHRNKDIAKQLQLFFAGCVAVAGIVGAISADIKILFIQTVPALLAMVTVTLAKQKP